jgi:uncharacterized membrane protein
MSEYRYGPVEFYLIGFEGSRPSDDSLAALVELVETDLIRLLDFVLIEKDADGELTILEASETDDFGLDVAILHAPGIAGDEDIAEYGGVIPNGSSAALVVVELTYQRELAERFANSGGALLGYDRVPAPVVNALMDSFDEITEE